MGLRFWLDRFASRIRGRFLLGRGDRHDRGNGMRSWWLEKDKLDERNRPLVDLYARLKLRRPAMLVLRAVDCHNIVVGLQGRNAGGELAVFGGLAGHPNRTGPVWPMRLHAQPFVARHRDDNCAYFLHIAGHADGIAPPSYGKLELRLAAPVQLNVVDTRPAGIDERVVAAGRQVDETECAVVTCHRHPLGAIGLAHQHNHCARPTTHLAGNYAAADHVYGRAGIEVDYHFALVRLQLDRLLQGRAFDAQHVTSHIKIGQGEAAAGFQPGARSKAVFTVEFEHRLVGGIGNHARQGHGRHRRRLRHARDLGLGLQRAHDRQYAVGPAFAVPGVALPPGAAAAKLLIRQQPKRRAEIVVRRRLKALARAHHDAARFQRLGHVEVRRSRRVAGVRVFADEVAAFGGQDRAGCGRGACGSTHRNIHRPENRRGRPSRWRLGCAGRSAAG